MGEAPFKFFTPEIYGSLGKNLLVSVLDVWQKNPWSRVADLSELRRDVAGLLKRLERFRRF
jgi:hypothetical protein